MSREAAEAFFALTGRTVDQRIQGIAETSRAVVASLENDSCPHKPATINRWAIRSLDLCSRTFCCPPPVELVALIQRQLGVAGEERDGNRKNRATFIAAANHVAKYPDATPTQIAHAIKYDQKRVIKAWLEDQEFSEIVGMKRRRILYMEKKLQEGT